ncbi:CGNR zinc finger domain-containing protein [Rathayibacter agropyri]|uniref:CGNR zinc finger domain-containing protein n=1 Tax=Rathayibacter agropyri TaxID=1634927 RepID=UPI0015677B51|nr:CGNR zinc finger domain-containing protein [Rathayibacter agropyri]NRD09523.1 CGNR zinc finger domain-containing protein [Rathayibacter agropyri]
MSGESRTIRGHAPSTGQWLAEADGRRWWFDSGSLALDFATTGAVPHGATEQFDSDAALTVWLAERFDAVDTGSRDARLDDALMLRSAIARLAEATEAATALDPRDIDVVNLVAAMPDIPPALSGGSRQAGRTSASGAQALATIARQAVELLGSAAAGRLRRCAAPECRMLYLDTSRAGSRRWCSMQRCGNRAKVRAHRERAAASRRPAATPSG